MEVLNKKGDIPECIKALRDEVHGELVEVSPIIKNMFSNMVIDDSLTETKEAELQAKLSKENEITEDIKLRRIKDSGVDSKYWGVNYSSYVATTDQQKVILQKVCEYIKDVQQKKVRTLWMCGSNGTGKTLLASLICKETLGVFRNVYDIEDELEETKNFQAKESRKELFKRYKDYDVLIIDEVGRTPDNRQFELKMLFHILNDRYNANKSTVLITNMNKKSMSEYLGFALYDRFSENCQTLEFIGKSARGGKNPFINKNNAINNEVAFV